MPETDPRNSGPHKRDESGHLPLAVGEARSTAAGSTAAASTAAASTVAGSTAAAGTEEGSELIATGRAAQRRAESGRAAPDGRASDGKRGHSQVFLWLKEVATVVAIAVVLSFLIKTFLFRAFYIPSESMVDTLDINDRIFVNLLVPEPFALARGDVVVFRDTKSWLPQTPAQEDGPFTWFENGLIFVGLLPDDSEQHLVKRVIGLPGDHVVCCDADGRLTINGAPLQEGYVNTAEAPQVLNFDVTVPAGKVWVMGDNRNHSADSRAHQDSSGGFIDLEDVEGKATVIAWPLNRLAILDNYPDVFRNVPAPAGK
jgi:signal peptidase I